MATFKEPKRNYKDSNEQAQENSVGDKACASDFVKCTGDGQMDWKTLANIITANLLGEVLCASYADYKYGRRTKGFKPDIEWTFSYEENDILIFKKKKSTDQNLLCFMGRSMINQPVSSVAAVLQKFENLYIWNKCITESRLVEVLSESDNHRDIIGYFVHEVKRCLIRNRRDAVLFIHSNSSADRFVQVGISVDHPSCPPVSGITRAKCCLGSGWVVEAYEGHESKSLVSFVCNIDPKIAVPPIILNRFMQKQPRSIRYLKQIVMEDTLKLKPHHKGEFTVKSSKVLPHKRTKGFSGGDPDEDLSTKHSVSLDSSNDTVRSFVLVNNNYYSSMQYEEPIGISEFIGHDKERLKQARKHSRKYCQRCADVLGGKGRELLITSGSCEECGISKVTGCSTST